MFYSLFTGISVTLLGLTQRWPALLPPALVVMAGLWPPATWAKEVAAVQSERLGTLFYSVSERKNIARTRTGAALGTSPQEVQEIGVNGIVKRQGTHSTAWVNGKPVRDGAVLSADQRVIITQGGIRLDGKNLRVGEKIDLITREHTDVVPPGALTKRAAP